MFENEILEFCILHKIKVQQYFFLWSLLNRDWNKPYVQSVTKRYLREVTIFTSEDIDELSERGIIQDLNVPPNTLPEMYIVNESIAKEIFADDEAGIELWNEYPPTFPLSSGGSFIARAGGDKDELIEEYLTRIKNHPGKHKFVMKQLKNYRRLVADGKINGHKISDFIRMELWDTIAQIMEKDFKEKGGLFGKAI